MTRSIAVAGKGGTGKSTVAALIVLQLCKNGMGPVLAIDADADANLGTLLGVQPTQSIGDLREDLRKTMDQLPPGMSKAAYFEAGLHQIVEEADGFDLITMGKGEGSGCYCSLNHLIRKFSDDLMPSYAWMVLDNEAGLEHISRRTTSNIDVLLVVVNGSPLALNTARTIANLTTDLESKIRKQYVVTNMIPEQRRDAVLKAVAELPMEHLCDIPYDEKLDQAVANGLPLSKLTDSTTQDYIRSIVQRIGDEHGDT